MSGGTFAASVANQYVGAEHKMYLSQQMDRVMRNSFGLGRASEAEVQKVLSGHKLSL